MCGVLDVVGNKKGWITPALLASEPVFCSPCINPRLSRKMCPRARIYALYGRSMRPGAGHFYTPLGRRLDTASLLWDLGMSETIQPARVGVAFVGCLSYLSLCRVLVFLRRLAVR